MIPIIDTHQHLVLSEKWPYSWADGLPFLKGNSYTLEDYTRETEGTGIEKTIFMETSPDGLHWLEETSHVATLCDDPDGRMMGAIVNCRPEEERFQEFLDTHAHAKQVGVRRILHVEDDSLSGSTLFRDNVRSLAARDLTFDLCFLARQLPLAYDLAKACPNVQFVLDHCGVPDIEGAGLDPWRADIRKLAELPNLACKISGVLAYCNPGNASLETVKPYVEHCLEAFGWDRVVWGGDWPVCTGNATLAEWVSVSREIVSSEDTANQEKLFNRNACSIYGVQS
ncbi:amidohydrolase family protein [Pelagicoccus mobilis]|uniref:Amidohydrolase n=1 Tax=Pelagicoccus mobilis TaxID=415221 RepID=A0A934VJP1_9BACT|nr:amidohydrolase [Pelagicoccus mobilis]MBK1875826.1 amidohydrolase [Pelagicoccus mobilis]